MDYSSSDGLGSESLEISPNYNPTTPFIVWLLFVIAYFIVLVPWIGNWVVHRRSSGIPLHRMFAVTLFLQFAVSVILCSFYGVLYNRKRMGNLQSISLTYFTNWEITVIVLSVIAEGVFDGLIILISKGWCITQPTLSIGYKCCVAFYVIVYIVLTVINNIYYSPVWVLFLVSVILLAMYIGLILYVFNAVNQNVRALIARIHPEVVNVPLQVQPYNPNPYPQPAAGYIYPVQGAPAVNPYTIAQTPAVYVPGNQQANPYTNPNQNQIQDSPNITTPQNQGNVYGANPYVNNEGNSSPATILSPNPVPTDPPMAYSPSQTNPFNTEMQSPSGHVPETIATSKLKLELFRTYHKFLVFYIVASLLFSFLPAFFFTWSSVLSYLKYLLVLLFLSGLCWVFRLRPVNRAQYYLLGDEDSDSSN
eukprot:TRINITY_DN5043_c0_g1_i1.p1 TRINITY_DN5043_c0_g1~~TRINITY_DN5043_c0_g1_i1.p1  ORF type:complete len:420 (-),score=63.07 TRINITY_DN5043_c0_g1_i1:222-1481(-)